MSDKNTIELLLSAKNEKLIKGLAQGEKQIKAFGDKTVATFSRIGGSMKMFSNSIVTGMSAMGLSYGLLEMGKDIMAFDGTLRRIGRTSALSAKDIQGLRQTIIGLIDPAAKVKIPLSKGEFADMAWELNATGIQLNVIKDLLPQVGKGAVAAGVNNKIYAGTIGELLDKYKVLLKDLPALQEQLNMAMKFQDVRKNPEEFLQALTGMSKTMQLIGASGMENATPLIALIAQLTEISGSATEASGSVNGLMNGIFRLAKNRPKVADLKSHGIEFFNKEGGMKSIEELLPQIRKLGEVAAETGMDIDAVAMNVFGRPEAGKAIMLIVKQYDEIIKKQRQLKASSGGLDKDFETETKSMSAKLKEFQNQLDSFKVNHMSAALKFLSSLLDQLNKHPMIAKGLLGGLAVGAGAVILQKSIGAIGGLINLGRDIGGIWTGKGKGGLSGGIAGPLGRGMAGPVPVYVVNDRLSLIDPTGGSRGTIPGGNMPGGGKAGKIAGALGKAGMVTGAGIAGYEIGGLINEGLGWTSGKLTGGKHSGEGWLGSMLYDFFHKAENPKVKNEIKLNINIDKNGRVIADGGGSGTDLDISLERGAFGS